MILLRNLIVCIDDGPGMHLDQLQDAFSSTFMNLCTNLSTARTYQQFSLMLDCLDAIIRKRSWSISQWNIDSAIGSIVHVASASGPHLPRGSSGPIFLRLCTFTGTLLTTNRKKLGGRFHLIITLMQSLLRCLFVPNAQYTPPARLSSRPPWCSGKRTTLGAKHAVAYARLLTLLCEPTVSSVTASRGRYKQDLSDEVQKARATAGKYLPYLLMEYAQCLLHLRLSPDSRSALNPGFYAVFNLMTPEAMRTLNASMDSSSRSIFKTLYDDYRRFGRWEEK